MEYEQMNSILYDTINDIYPIATSRISILPISNDYNYFPYFRFRFKDKEKDDVIYVKIQYIIEKFEGLLDWKMVSAEYSQNYLIVPAYVDVWIGLISKNINEYLINSLGEEEFKRRIDDAIVDIPKLAEAIKQGFIES
jgi:hypothetical protein